MLEGGTAPNGGKGTAFDEITVSFDASRLLTATAADCSRLLFLQHIIVDEVHERSIECESSTSFSLICSPLELTISLRSSSPADFLLIVLKTLLEQRKDLKYVLSSLSISLGFAADLRPSSFPLRIVLMSATVDADKISDFFGGCPTLSVPGRTFPVRTFFLEDAVEYSKWFINGESQYARRCESSFSLSPSTNDLSRASRLGADCSLFLSLLFRV